MKTYEVLNGGDLLLQEVSADLVILDNAADLELLDAVADSDELGGAPQETVSLNLAHLGLQRGHVGLIVPGLDVEQNVGLGDEDTLLGLLGGLALVVGGDTLGLDTVLA